MVLQLLRCIGLATAERAGDALRNRRPLDEHLYDISKNALAKWKMSLLTTQERTVELQKLTESELSTEEVSRQAEQIANEVAPDLRPAVTEYLERLPCILRRSLTRLEEGSTRTSANPLTLENADDLIRLLPPRLPHFKPGDRPSGLDDAVLEELLGIGGFGEVWKANRSSGSPMALKFCIGDEGRRLLAHEAALNRMMNARRHPGIVELRQAHLHSQPPCLEYEYVEGPDLASLIRLWAANPPADRVDRSVAIIRELAEIVSFAHELDPPVVHRDLKPSNVLLQPTTDGFRLRVTDFGIGDVAATQAVRQSLVTSVRGALTTELRGAHTALYASPEQKAGAEARPSDDVHALGVIWYQLLVGKLNREPGPTLQTTLKKREVPDPIVELVLNCLKKAEQRIATATLLSSELAKFFPPPKQSTNSIGMQFAFVPKGAFWMSENDKNAQRQVAIAQDFYVGVYSVTQGQWQAVMGKNPSWFSRNGGGKNEVERISDEDLARFPVENVSWEDVQEFIQRLNEEEKNSGWVHRLPTESEWEYSCRGGATSKEDCSFDFYFARPTNNLSSEQANFEGNHPYGNASEGPYLGRTTKVGSYEPNPLGLYDLHGNVWEWCQDLYEGGSNRVFRGGCWSNDGESCRAASRSWLGPSSRENSLGFRLARSSVGAQAG